jgi:hypothetical protein
MTTYKLLFGATEAVDSTRFPGTQSFMSTVLISFSRTVFGPVKADHTEYATFFCSEPFSEAQETTVSGPDLEDALETIGLELTIQMSKPTSEYPEAKQFYRLKLRK